MRLVIAAVGRLKQGPERELAERYAKRASETGRALGWRPVEVIELRESRAQETDKRKLEESIALANVIPEGSTIIVLEERGESLDSASFAAKLRGWSDAGQPALSFLIGGPDGLAASLRDRAKLHLAFGAATWPHQMVRIMLLEQLYRTATILSGHPYHRV